MFGTPKTARKRRGGKEGVAFLHLVTFLFFGNLSCSVLSPGSREPSIRLWFMLGPSQQGFFSQGWEVGHCSILVMEAPWGTEKLNALLKFP